MKLYCSGLIIALFLLGTSYAETRDSQVYYNPGCNIDQCKNVTSLVYVKATGASDTLHILYSAIGAFTIMSFKTDLKSNLTVNWTDLLSNNVTLMYKSIGFTIQPNESCAFLVPKIYEFNDKNGDADMTKIPTQNLTNFWVIRNTADLSWRFMPSNGTTIGSFIGENMNKTINGTFKFNIRYYGKEERDKDLPHYLVSSESSSIDFIVDGVQPSFKDSKFGVYVLYASNMQTVDLKNSKSLDDEYTPGTFQQWTVEGMDSSNKIHSYLQWKPIFYYDKKATLENSTETKQYKLDNNQVLPLSLATAYFDSNMKYSGFNVSFGLEGNEKDAYFYPQSNYSSWSFMSGIGEPAEEKMSSIVKLVIFIGFGLPGAVIVIGLFALAIRKCRGNSNRNNYESI